MIVPTLRISRRRLLPPRGTRPGCRRCAQRQSSSTATVTWSWMSGPMRGGVGSLGLDGVAEGLDVVGEEAGGLAEAVGVVGAAGRWK